MHPCGHLAVVARPGLERRLGAASVSVTARSLAAGLKLEGSEARCICGGCRGCIWHARTSWRGCALGRARGRGIFPRLLPVGQGVIVRLSGVPMSRCPGEVGEAECGDSGSLPLPRVPNATPELWSLHSAAPRGESRWATSLGPWAAQLCETKRGGQRTPPVGFRLDRGSATSRLGWQVPPCARAGGGRFGVLIVLRGGACALSRRESKVHSGRSSPAPQRCGPALPAGPAGLGRFRPIRAAAWLCRSRVSFQVPGRWGPFRAAAGMTVFPEEGSLHARAMCWGADGPCVRYLRESIAFQGEIGFATLFLWGRSSLG